MFRPRPRGETYCSELQGALNNNPNQYSYLCRCNPTQQYSLLCTDRFYTTRYCYTKTVMKPFFTYIFSAIVVVTFFTPNFSDAASLYIDPATHTLNRGDSVTLAIRLDTDELAEECINAVDAVLTYSDNIEPVDVSIGDSIFNIWVEQPTINRENRTITFAGGIPNGYCGRVTGDPRLTNTLAKVVFRSPGFSIGGGSSGELEAEVAFSSETTAYLNDGQGTKADLVTYWSTIKLNPKAGQSMTNSWQEEVSADTIPPEKFSIQLLKDDKAFSQKYYIIFNTTDKQTGVDHYEVMEEPLSQFGAFQWGRADAPWIVTRSPYVLKDQSLNSIIRVKAIDKAGNEYITNLIPDESARTISKDQLITYILALGLVITFVVISVVGGTYIRRRNKKLVQNNLDNNEDIE